MSCRTKYYAQKSVNVQTLESISSYKFALDNTATLNRKHFTLKL